MTTNTIVFDFETPSLNRDAGILSIGACKFDRFSLENSRKLLGNYVNQFTVNIDLTEQFFAGFHMDQETAKWWRDRNYHEIPRVLKERKSIRDALNMFDAFVGVKDHLLFCRHTHADFTWYENACKLLNREPAIRYNRVYDVATAVLTRFDEPKGRIDYFKRENAHNALQDAVSDSLQVAACFDKSFVLEDKK